MKLSAEQLKKIDRILSYIKGAGNEARKEFYIDCLAERIDTPSRILEKRMKQTRGKIIPDLVMELIREFDET